jgi:hypothetical protein
VTDRPVKVVLDTSAIVAFTRGSIDVGEVIAEIDDEYAAAGPPVLCLVEASSVVAFGDRRELLVNHPATAVLAPDPGDWQALAAVYESVGRLDAASAVLAAIDLGCQVLSGRPGQYAGLEGIRGRTPPGSLGTDPGRSPDPGGARLPHRARSVLASTYGFPESESDLLARGLISAGSLDPYKARILLHLLLASNTDRADISAAFARA